MCYLGEFKFLYLIELFRLHLLKCIVQSSDVSFILIHVGVVTTALVEEKAAAINAGLRRKSSAGCLRRVWVAGWNLP